MIEHPFRRYELRAEVTAAAGADPTGCQGAFSKMQICYIIRTYVERLIVEQKQDVM